MHQIDLESIELKSDIYMRALRIAIYCESRLFGIKKIYESRVLSPTKHDDFLIINERVNFDLDHEQSFLKFVIEYRENGQGELAFKWHEKVFFTFLADLLNEKNFFEIKFKQSRSLRLNYTVKTPFQAKFVDEEKFAPELKMEEQSGMLEMLALSQAFLKRFAALRRLLEDVTEFALAKNMPRDIKILVVALLLILFPNYVLLVAIVLFFVTNWKYRVRFWVVEKFIGYFFNESSTAEIKKNLEFVKKQQEGGLELLIFLKSATYSKNRIYLYHVFSKGMIAALVGLLMLVNIPFKLMLLSTCVGLFCMKYKDKVLEVVQSYQMDEKKMKVWLEKGKAWLEFIKAKTSSAPQRLTKTCYVYENQRWYIHTGFTNKTLAFERPNFSDVNGDKFIELGDFKLGDGWIWDGDWEILKNEDTDPDGWKYAKSFKNKFRKTQSPLATVRRRVWVRKCYSLA